jgi:hypothetical protein
MDGPAVCLAIKNSHRLLQSSAKRRVSLAEKVSVF